MKKEEAEKKWCPFARVPTIEQDLNSDFIGIVAANRFHAGDIDPDFACITDRCMAWEPVYGPWEQVPRKDEGYCGLMDS